MATVVTMIDSLTKRPFEVHRDDQDLSFILVQADQLPDVQGVLDRAGIRFSIEFDVMVGDGGGGTHSVTCHDASTDAVQQVLDDAAVKISIQLADGGLQEYFQPDTFIERYDQSVRQGYRGNDLVHELFTDDWAVPPILIQIEGQRLNGQTFRQTLPYEVRKRR